ncbi:dihydroxyacetone kinase subunit L [Shumkonia mesophila]|uniref:dihydroxyacetone kinase subunit L n=1 Tax=Shumkonia mesophila TaxID=2838854 RepID=UPI002934F6E4|nr:dihydroxyacetone kinase subunit L [Shumkonia mesophila]
MALTTDVLKRAWSRIAAAMDRCKDELNTLDGAVGDGDLGITMSRGANEVMEQIDSLPEDVGMAFMKTAQAFTKTSASTFGTLIATGLMAAAKATKGRTDVPWSEMPALLDAAILAMMARGKANLGDKTVLDGLAAIQAAIAGIDDPERQLAAASQAMEAALDAFRDKPNKVGRARIFADKTIGLNDPGMMALTRVIEGIRN